ncbi:MAG: gliding motility-associated C-terminal domain-containing protein [Bacteroidota bacterium]|nr:gliding motility-associated C-terminal domain-containing protein [Bacteroidota bacterium]
MKCSLKGTSNHMSFIRKFILLIGCFVSVGVNAQSDTSFWFAAPSICSGHENIPEVFRLATYDKAADITISQPANPNFQPYSIHLNAYQEITQDITSQMSMVENNPADTKLNYGIKITATNSISAYYEVGHSKNPEIFPLKGKLGTGLNFLIPGQTDFANGTGGLYVPQPKNGFVVVATQDNTTVTVTVSNDAIGHSKGSTFSITLNKGQSYAVVAQNIAAGTHLGGSTVTADKPIAVTIYDDSVGPSSTGNRDLIGDQILPENNNGTDFIIVRGALSYSNQTQDYYYVWPTVDGTTISVNGSILATVNRGQCYRGTISSNSAYIQTSTPSYVYQVTGIGGEMASTNLPAIKCTGSQLVSFIRSTTETFQLNLLCKTPDIGNFTLNGQSGIITAAMFQPVPGMGGIWQAARIDASLLPNIDQLFTTTSPSVVANTTGLFHLGFLNGGTSTGSRLGYFSNYSTVKTSPSVASISCFGNNIQLLATKITDASYQWTGPNGFTSTVYNPVIANPTYANSGMYFLTANINGCGTSVDSVSVIVHPLPTLAFVKPMDTVCYGDNRKVNFSLLGTAPFTITYGMANGVSTQTLTTAKDTASFYTPTLSSNTIYAVQSVTDSNSCVTSVSNSLKLPQDTLIVNPLPVAKFGYNNPSCEKHTIRVFDQSTASLDTLTHWYWIVNGSVRDVYNRDTFTTTYSSWGSYPVKLAVQSSLGCKSDTAAQNIAVHPLPKPGFILPEVCLSDAYAQFADTSSIADQSTGFTYHWNFGDATAGIGNPDTSILQNPKHRYNQSGYYKVALQVTSANGCSDSLTQNFIVNGAIPKAAFSLLNTGTKCSNDSVKIQNLSTVDFGNITAVKIYWDYSNEPLVYDSVANPSFNDIYTHLYKNFNTATKNVTIHYMAFSGITCVSSKDTVITLTSSPVVQFTTLPGICYDASARQITEAIEINNIQLGVFSYVGKGISATGLINPVQAGVGKDSVMALYVSSAGCRDSAYQVLTVWPSPQAKWGVANPKCEKNDILFIDSSAANFSKIQKWDWQFGDQTTQTRSDSLPFPKQYAAYGNYTVSLVVTTDSGCVSSPTAKNIIVHPLPVVSFGVPNAVCLPDGHARFYDSSQIADQSQNLFTYVWKFSDGSQSEQSLLKNPVHQYSALGAYPVELIVTSKDGCVDSLDKMFSNIYPQPKASFTTDRSEVCRGDSIHFYDATTGFTDSIVSWHWDLSQSVFASLPNTSRQFADSGTFVTSLYIFDAKGCVSDTASNSVIVDPYPVLILPHRVNVLQGNSAMLQPIFFWIDGPPAPVYQWSPSLYLNTDTVLVPTTTPLDDITYRLSITGKGGCITTDTVFVKMLKTPIIPNAFSPNGDGINDTWMIRYLNDYPGAKVSVFNRYGQLLFSATGYDVQWDGTYNGSPLPVGTYYYVINPGNGRQTMSGSVTIIR